MENVNAFQAAPNRKKLLTLLALYTGIIGAIMVSATGSTMLPAAAIELGGMEIYSLASTLSGVVSVVAMPLYGYFAAKNPAIKSRLFAFSLAVGAVAMFVRVFAHSMLNLVITGALYGLVSAAVYVLGYSMVRDVYDGGKAAVYLGFVGTFQSIGMLIGPTLCGIIIDTVSWRGVNHLVWPFMLLSAVFATMGVNVKTEDVKDQALETSFDAVGAVFLVLFLGGLILMLSLGTSFAKFGTAPSYILIAIALVGLIGLVAVIKKKGEKCIVPATVLKDRNTLCLTLANLFINFSNMAVYFFIPSYCLYAIQVSGTQAGLTTTLMSVAGLFMGPIYGKQIGKTANARGVLFFGLSLRIVITVLFMLVLRPTTPIMIVYILMVAAGFYSSQAGVTFAIAPQVQVRPEIRVQSNSIIQIGQNFGGGIGTAVFSLVIGMLGIEKGMSVAFVIALITAAIALVCSVPLKKLESEV